MMMNTILRSSLLLLFLLVVNCSTEINSAEPFNQQVDVFQSGTEEYHTFRIPSVVVTNRGTVLAFCEAHRFHYLDAGDIDIVLRRSFDGGRTWGDLQVVWSDGVNTCGGPTVVVDRITETVWLHSHWNHGADWQPEVQSGIGKDTFRAYVTHSTDDGATWSAAREITQSAKKPSGDSMPPDRA